MSERPAYISLFWGSLVGGGVERVMIALASSFLNRGIETDVVLLERQGELLGELPSSARVINLNAEGIIESLPALTRYLRQHHPSVLLSAAPYPNRLAVLARMFAAVRTAIVISEHSIQAIRSSKSRLPDWGVKQLTKWTYSQADRRIAVSNGVAEEVPKFIGAKSQRFEIVYNPVVGPDTFERANAIVEHSWFRNSRTPVILGVGRLVGEKDFSTLLEAFAKVRQTRDARLVILGEGKQRPFLEQQARSIGVENHVWMPGFVSNPLKYMAEASVFVLSSKSEGLGNVLIEAMASGTPVVSTNCDGGPSEILEGGTYGELAPVGDPTALAAAIEKAFDGKVPPAPPSALDRFRRDRVAEQYLDILSSVA